MAEALPIPDIKKFSITIWLLFKQKCVKSHDNKNNLHILILKHFAVLSMAKNDMTTGWKMRPT